MAGRVGSESRMLIDAKPVPASDGTTDGNVNPATEGVLGRVAEQHPETTTIACIVG